ncbi:hypothetical protein B0H14DRAFT_2960299 [Mycena olivaceomarginata]|nr:hypothetical protein B0H14DRAFT_2960299 [Mycena olivaceomarginata]
MSAQPAIVFDGPLEDLTKKQVDPICIALNLPYKNKKKDGLVKLIKTTLFSISPELEQDPRFSKLYKYGRDTPTEQQPKKGKKSVAKAKEDLVEAGKPQKPLTGANLTLHEQKSTTDPPAGFAPLGLQGNRQGKVLNTALIGDLSSVSPSSSPGPELAHDEDSGKEQDEEPARKDTRGTANVLVKIHRHRDDAFPAEDIIVQNVPVTQFETPGGTANVEALLTELLPRTLNSNSPMKKDRAGRFFRSSIFENGSRMDVGTVAQQLDGPTPANLSWSRANALPLERLEDDLFGATLYFHPSAAQHVPTVTSLTGAGTDKPLLIAQARAQLPKPAPLTKAVESPELLALLRALAAYDSKDGELPKKKSVTAAVARDNYHEYQAYLHPFLEYGKKTDGFYFPSDWEAPDHVAASITNWQNFRNKSFTKDNITVSAGLTTTSTNSNNTLFARAIALGGKVASWVKQEGTDGDTLSPDVRSSLDKKYGTMGLGSFRKYIDDKTNASKNKLSSQAGPSKPKRKRSVSAGSAGSAESDDGPSKKKKKPARKDGDGKEKRKSHRKEVSEENLDDDSS